MRRYTWRTVKDGAENILSSYFQMIARCCMVSHVCNSFLKQMFAFGGKPYQFVHGTCLCRKSYVHQDMKVSAQEILSVLELINYFLLNGANAFGCVFLSHWLKEKETSIKLGASCVKYFHRPMKDLSSVILAECLSLQLASVVCFASSKRLGKIRCPKQSIVSKKKFHFMSLSVALAWPEAKGLRVRGRFISLLSCWRSHCCPGRHVWMWIAIWILMGSRSYHFGMFHGHIVSR